MDDQQQKSLRIIGVMSGTSLDGLDLAYCQFTSHIEGQNKIISSADDISYTIIYAETIPYDDTMRNSLHNSMNLSGLELSKLDRLFGKFIGDSISNFIEKYKINPKSIDYISSHGHTVFHNPAENYTVQIGHGSSIAAACKIPTICDFRSVDVALGGQGAPLVPIGDMLLFNQYKYCLNVGGILNISFDEIYEDKIIRKAFDLSPGNIILNYLSKKYFGVEYDIDGIRASQGTVSQALLQSFLNLEFFRKTGPKSLGKEDVEKDFLKLVEISELSPQDKLCTVVELMAQKTSEWIKGNNSQKNTNQSNKDKVLITGGGAYNKYFITRLHSYLDNNAVDISIPDNLIVEFKEALLFAFLGFLRVQKIPNCLKSVTGATQDNIGGCIYKI